MIRGLLKFGGRTSNMRKLTSKQKEIKNDPSAKESFCQCAPCYVTCSVSPSRPFLHSTRLQLERRIIKKKDDSFFDDSVALSPDINSIPVYCKWQATHQRKRLSLY